MCKICSAVLLALLFLCACKQDPLATLPSFNLLLSDSTVFNTKDITEGKVTVLLHFEADCTDCQHETEAILKNMEAFKQVQFYFLTTERFERLRVFNQHYKMVNYPNIVTGQDYERFFQTHFKNPATPYLALYDKDKMLRAMFKGPTDIQNILNKVKEIQ